MGVSETGLEEGGRRITEHDCFTIFLLTTACITLTKIKSLF